MDTTSNKLSFHFNLSQYNGAHCPQIVTNKDLLHRCSEDPSFKRIYHNDVEIRTSKLMKKHPQCLTEASSRQIVRTCILFLPLEQ